MRAHLSDKIQSIYENAPKSNIENYDPYTDPKITPSSVCNSGNSDYEDAVKQKKISIKLLTDDFKKKGKVSQTIAAGIDENSNKDMTPKQFCDSVNRSMAESIFSFPSGLCSEVASEVHKAYTSDNLIAMNFQEACKVLLPKLQSARSKMRECETRAGEKRNEALKTTQIIEDSEIPKQKMKEQKPSSLKQQTHRYLIPGSSSSAQ
jgi:hypothetical protein